ncbi:MAG: ABC transporter permease [Desulfitobacteriaceae bacterium]|nr:ABC transporter permease [Desulfitobacteriaceae bacterium]
MKTRILNSLFQGTNFLFGLALVVLIVVSVSLVIIRGIPQFGVSIHSPEILFAIKLSLYTSLLSTLFCTIISIPVAYYLARIKSNYTLLVNTVLDIPLALPPIVSGVALLLLFGTTEFGRTLSHMGLEFVFTVQGIILAQVFVNISYMIKIIYTSFISVSPRMEFVARGLGYNQLETFVKITLPLARQGILAAIIITWAKALGEFGAALMLAGATRLKTETLPLSLFLNMSTGELELAMAAATILIVISVLSLLVFEFLGSEGIVLDRTGRNGGL